MCSVLATSSRKGWTKPGKSAMKEQQATSCPDQGDFSSRALVCVTGTSWPTAKQGLAAHNPRAPAMGFQRAKHGSMDKGDTAQLSTAQLLDLGNEGNDTSRASWGISPFLWLSGWPCLLLLDKTAWDWLLDRTKAKPGQLLSVSSFLAIQGQGGCGSAS